VSAALAAAGAFQNATGFSVQGADQATIAIAYTRGAAAGYPIFRLTWNMKIGGAAADYLGVMRTGANLDAEQYALLNTDGLASYTRAIAIAVPMGAQYCRVSIAEAGAIATPGTATIWAFVGSSGA
jgi:hypothetical protein